MRKIFLLFVFTLLFLNCKEAKKNEIIPQKKEVKKNIQIKEECSQDFDQFFKKFAKDSVYQKEHIKFPLKYLFYDNYQYEILTTKLINNKSAYKYVDFSEDFKAMQLEIEKFTVEKEKTKEGLIYKHVGYDNGLYMSYEFKIIGKCWYLIKITDQST
jgi:hypothetical protein